MPPMPVEGRRDNLPLAVTVIILTVLALSLGDALIKMTSNGFVIWQIFVIRSLIAIPVLLLILAAIRPEAARRRPDIWPDFWVVLRSLVLVAMWVLYYLSLTRLSLAVAAAAYYTLPIFIALLSALFLGDKVSAKGWIAVLLGFLGVLLILRPGTGEFNVYLLLPLCSAILYAGAMILTRSKCRDQYPILLSLALNLAFVVAGLSAAGLISFLPDEARHGYLLGHWAAMGDGDWLTMGLMAAAILIGSIGAAIAYQNGPPAIIGAFDFAYIGFAVIWGIVFFGESPDLVATLGILLITGSGILSLRQ